MQGWGKGLGWRCSQESGPPPRPERGGAGAVRSEAEAAAGSGSRAMAAGLGGLPQRPLPRLHHPGGTHVRHRWGWGGSGAAGLPLGEGPGEGLASRGAGGHLGLVRSNLPRDLGQPPPHSHSCRGALGLTPWDSRHRPQNMLLGFPGPSAHLTSQGHRHHPTWRWQSLCVSLASKNTSSSARGAGHSWLRTAGASPAGSVGY